MAATSVNLDAAAVADLELRGIKLIEASAGTGKTHTIADLYLRHVLAGRQPAQILIVTYTNAATEELRGRIHARLYQALNLLLLDNDSEDALLALLLDRFRNLDEDSRQQQIRRLQFALRSMDEASISTIHSFCQRALQDHALSGNQLFESELLTDDREIWEDAIKDWWRSTTYGLSGEAWRLIRNQLPSLGALTATLLDLRNKPSANLLPAGLPGIDELLQRPRKIARDLHRLTPLWKQHKADIIDILMQTKVLSRRKGLPYHPDILPGFLETANRFFTGETPEFPFDQFEFIGSELLHHNSTPKKRGQDPRLQHEFFIAVNTVAESWLEFNATISPALRIAAFHASSRQVRETKRELVALAFQDQLTLLLEALQSGSGETLAQNLRQQYPVAMIDEFQDTDAIQYDIFSRIYMTSVDTSITLIGDPKQAIYSFRGGDIFTYMQARHHQGVELYSLQTNWRSQPNLVTAINRFFSHRADTFVYRESISFAEVAAVAENAKYELRIEHRATTAMTIWQLPRDEQGGNYSRTQMREMINQAVVAEVATLLANSTGQAAIVDGSAVQSGDIAILVRQASEGHALSRELHRKGIRTVTIGRDSVFESTEAIGLFELLLAISQCQDSSLAARSLSSSLLCLDYLQIAAIVDSDSAWQDWIEKLSNLQRLWERQGFIAMFQSLLHQFEISRHLAQQEDSERRITNLLHLAELLQQQSATTAGMSSLISWFRQQTETGANEAAELRLENDEELVKIVTIHKAKGLQYPIVFVPFLWSCRQVDRKGTVYFHNAELQSCIDLGSPEFEQNWRLAEKERLAEDMRLLYVALTRARSRVYLTWGLAGSPNKPGYADQTALAYLLHSTQTPQDLEMEAVCGFGESMDFDADLKKLIDSSDACIDLVALPQPDSSSIKHSSEVPPEPVELANFSRKHMPNWRVQSFTGLTRGVHQPAHMGTVSSQTDLVLEFPAGSHIGIMIHSLLENLDFQLDIETQCRQLFPRFLPGSGITSENHQQTLIRWLEYILRTSLDGDQLSLGGLANCHRLNELSFDFALDHLSIDNLNQQMQSLSPVPLAALSSTEFSGMINGVIDLVFEYRGRYFLADYKSNFLGSSLEDYRPEQLELAMLHRRYDLQSLIYSIALHRFLSQRIPGYDYDRHFGGSYYLFLRAMRPQHGMRYGVHFERPDYETICSLEELFEFTPPEAVSA